MKRTNLITNPSFETGTAGWSGSGATIQQDAQTAKVGSKSLMITTTAATSYAVFAGMPIVAGKPLHVSFWLDDPNAANIIIHWVNSSGGIISQQTIPYSSALGWRQLDFTTQNAPTGAVKANLNIGYGTRTVGSILHLDAVLVEQGTTGAYFDGSWSETYRPTAIEEYAWTGTAHASTSTFTSMTIEVDNGSAVFVDGVAIGLQVRIDVYDRVERAGELYRRTPDGDVLLRSWASLPTSGEIFDDTTAPIDTPLLYYVRVTPPSNGVGGFAYFYTSGQESFGVVSGGVIIYSKTADHAAEARLVVGSDALKYPRRLSAIEIQGNPYPVIVSDVPLAPRMSPVVIVEDARQAAELVAFLRTADEITIRTQCPGAGPYRLQPIDGDFQVERISARSSSPSRLVKLGECVVLEWRDV